MIFVGLTDNPMCSRLDHGKPADWSQQRFSDQAEARQWLAMMVDREGYTTSDALDDEHWQFGYTCTVSLGTKEP